MANEAVVNNIYNYYLTTYAPKTDTKFDTHKKSELRSIYNSIVKLNTEDPLYIVDRSQSTKEFAVGLKENARSFKNTIASLGGLEEDELFNRKTANSSNSEIADALYIGDNDSEATAPSFDLAVSKLASPQTNIGKMLPSDAKTLPADLYSFDLGINGLNYEFQYNVSDNDTNLDIQKKLSRLISNANIGMNAEVVEDGQGNSALKLESDNTGIPKNGGHMFTVSDDNTSKQSGSVAYFGLDNIVNEADNAYFTINGEARQASGNTFTVEKQYEIHLKNLSASEDDATSISLTTDVDSLSENIGSFIDAYNSFVDKADAYKEIHPKSDRLVREMKSLASIHAQELGNLGISIKDDGRITLDKDKLQNAAATGEIKENFGALKNFAAAMVRKTNEVSLNPMNYAERTVVAYKNPGHNFATPYVTSAYTGMMFSSYC